MTRSIAGQTASLARSLDNLSRKRQTGRFTQIIRATRARPAAGEETHVTANGKTHSERLDRSFLVLIGIARSLYDCTLIARESAIRRLY